MNPSPTALQRMAQIPVRQIAGNERNAHVPRPWIADYLRMVLACTMPWSDARIVVALALGPDFDTPHAVDIDTRVGRVRRK
jgi:hypothetical protein